MMYFIDEYTITILFDSPFWIVLFERIEKGKYSVAKEILGTSEPTNAEIALFFDKLDCSRIRYSFPIEEEKAIRHKVNFKRMQRESRKATQPSECKYTYSKAHEELKKMRGQRKTEKKANTKIEKEQEKERKFEIKQKKKKQKMRGR